MKRIKFIALGFVSVLTASYLLLESQLLAKTEEVNATSRLEALTKFTKVVGAVEQYYVDDISIEEIIHKALTGLMTNLDAHSSYLDEKQFKDLKIQTEGEFGGLGITVGLKDGAITVIAPIEGTPADKAGIKTGDIILKINDRSTIDMTLDEAVSLMRGKPKTKITLTIVRKNEPKPLTFTIVRDIIKIQSVYTKKIDGNILYIRVTSFDKNVAEEVKKSIEKEKSFTKGIIIDLRNNPGGLLDQAVELVDLFVEEGVIVSQKGRIENENIVYKAKKAGTIKDIPLVVLVNGGSASASEIVSGALQDHKRAVIVGEKTFGKGSVQMILPITETEGLRLTVARYYLPSNRTIQAVGVTPDVIVYPGKVTTEENGFAIKEAELKKHLEGELEKIGDDNQKKEQGNKSKEQVISEKELYEDAQLKSGVDILKALMITRG